MTVETFWPPTTLVSNITLRGCEQTNVKTIKIIVKIYF